MKTSCILILILPAVALLLTVISSAAGQKYEPGVGVPKYNPAAEATILGGGYGFEVRESCVLDLISVFA